MYSKDESYSNRGAFAIVALTIGLIGLLIVGSTLAEFFVTDCNDCKIEWHEEGNHYHIPPFELAGIFVGGAIFFGVFATLMGLYYTRNVEHKNLITLAEAKDQSFKMMSHELRTPLAGIIGIADIIKEDFKDDPEKDYYMKMLEASAQHMSLMVNNILCHNSLVRTNTINAQYRIFNVCDLLEEVTGILQVMAISKDKNIDVDFQCTNTEINCDESLLRQILLNVAGNAVKFTDQGYVRISTTIDRDKILFKVQDTGVGISERDLEKVFAAYTQIDNPKTAKTYDGTGLGMSITKKIIRRLNGDISLESELGKGTTFYITIPINHVE